MRRQQLVIIFLFPLLMGERLFGLPKGTSAGISGAVFTSYPPNNRFLEAFHGNQTCNFPLICPHDSSCPPNPKSQNTTRLCNENMEALTGAALLHHPLS